ncbi:MAG: hemolysin family protein [Hyphomicrobiales bacterium]|nr:hemolysin family protein [Hyphomicrobiales bacterium]
MDPFVAVPVMIVLLLLKGFFSGSEIALVNADKIKLRHAAKQGHRGAELALKLLQKPEILLSTTLVGTNISTIALTTVGTLMMVGWFGQRGDLYAFLAYTPVFLVLGEIVPKSVYQQKASVLTPIIIFPLNWSAKLFYPVIFVFSRIARFCARLAGAGKSEQTLFITREQFRTLIDMAEQSAALSESNRGRIRRVIRFADTTVAEAMVPIAQVISLDREKIGKKRTRSAIELVRKHGFNRLPVYDKNTSNITGIVTMSTWEMLAVHANEKPMSDMIKPAFYVAPNQTIDGLLPELRKREDRMAIVVDEFGSAVGMITMEDIVEEVLGEIDVGYDFEEYQTKRRHEFTQLDDDVYLMDSRVSISEANEILGIHMPATEFHTLGGLVMGRLRRIPREGDYIIELGYRLTVAEATERSLAKLRVEPNADAQTGDAASKAKQRQAVQQEGPAQPAKACAPKPGKKKSKKTKRSAKKAPADKKRK